MQWNRVWVPISMDLLCRRICFCCVIYTNRKLAIRRSSGDLRCNVSVVFNVVNSIKLELSYRNNVRKINVTSQSVCGSVLYSNVRNFRSVRLF